MATIEDLKSWIERDITRFSPSEDHLKINKDTLPVDAAAENIFRFWIFTDNNKYAVAAREAGEGGYLGCIASSRKPRAGEDWNRGNDLNDGDLSEQTWHEILGDIISYEMVKIHTKQEQETTEEISVDPTD